MLPGDRKRIVRDELRARRAGLSVEAARAESDALVATLASIIAELAPPALASYQALRGEVPVAALNAAWRSRGGTLLLPRVRAPGELSWHEVRSDDELTIGAFGIREPRADAPVVALPERTVVIVPGVGFGRDGRRLGQGGGFYDRALAGRALIALGAGFACQRADDLPIEPHDRRMDGVVLGGELLRDPRATLGGGA